MQIMIQLGVIFILALAGLLAAIRMKMPPVIGIIIIGVLIGPNFLGLVQSDEVIGTFSSIGAVLLLFIIGIEFSLSKIIKFGIRALMFAIFKLSFVFLAIYALSGIFGLSIFECVLLGIIFSFSSTTLFAKLVEKYKTDYKSDIPLLYALLIIEDIIAVLALAVLPSATGLGTLYLDDIIISMAKSLAMLLLFFLIFRLVVRQLFEYTAFHSTEVLLFTSLSVCAVFVFMATFLGFEASIGAFLAGSLMASLKEFERIEKMMLPFGLFFSSFFFLSIGMSVDISNMGIMMALMVVVFLAISMAAKFISVGAFSYIFGSSMQTSVFSGVSMITASEFSLLIAKNMSTAVSFDIMSLTAIAVFASAIVSAITMGKIPQLSSFIDKTISFKIRGRMRNISTYLNIVTREFEPKGAFFSLFVDRSKIVLAYAAVLFIANGTILVLDSWVGALGFAPLAELPSITLKTIMQLVISSIIVFKMIESIEHILDGFINTFNRIDKKNIEMDRRIAYTSLIVVSLVGASVFIPFVLSMVNLSSMIFTAIQLILLAAAAVLIIDILLTANKMVERGIVKKIRYSRAKNKNFILDIVALPKL